MHKKSRQHPDRAFTLTELLVVIGIIVLLAGLAVPMVLRAYKQGNKTRTKADLNTIAIALNAYKQDFGDFPRVTDSVFPGTVPQRISGNNIGAAILCKALIGPGGQSETNKVQFGAIADNFDSGLQYQPGDVVRTTGLTFVCIQPTGTPAENPTLGPPGDKFWAPFPTVDGAIGPGFRTRRLPGLDNNIGTDDDIFQGKLWGPYLQAENFRLVGMNLYDRDEAPILYFPANPRTINIRGQITTQTGIIGAYISSDPSGPGSEQAMYDADDNLQFFWHPTDNASDYEPALKRMRAMLGEYNPTNPASTGRLDGKIDEGESPVTEAPFILWTAGPDGLFGPVRPADAPPEWPVKVHVERCDDVTSFTP
jgi:prepilin-type N-terminal cleavage/methylation domain-containing protein